MKQELENYLKLILPQPLQEDEYIRLLLLKANDGTPKCLYVKTLEDVSNAIDTYKFVFNMFINLSTYKRVQSVETTYQKYRRQVLFLDFDKKDYPELESVSEYSNLIRSKLPELFNHCIVASGSGGYHFYISTEESSQNDIIEINKKIANIVGADIRAVSSTQVVRLPTSYNLKDSKDKKYVKVVNNVYGTNRYVPYSISRLCNMIDFYERNNAIEIPAQEKPIKLSNDYQAKYYCVDNMINSGCKKGERNFAMGRIIAKLKSEKYQYDAAKQIILDWNKRCSPPKSVNETETDFDRYWENDDYRLLGCNINDERKKDILSNYCDKTKCLKEYEIKNDYSDVIFISEAFLSKRNLRRLNGNHYLIIFMMIACNYKINKSELKRLLKAKYNSRLINNLLKELIEYKIITENETNYNLKITNSKFNTKIKIKLTVIKKFLYSNISKTDFVIYLALCYLLQTKNNVTYNTLSEYLDKEKSAISTYINNLNKENLIKIDKIYNIKGLLCNRYTFI